MRAYFALEAWGAGMLAAALAWGSATTHLHGEMPDGLAFPAWALALALPLFAAHVVSARRVRLLDMGAVLALAHVPLGLAQGAIGLPARGYTPDTHLWCTCMVEHTSQAEVDRLFALAECSALACLVAGAVGLAARRPSAARLLALGLGVVGGAAVGDWLARPLLGLGAVAGLACVLMGVTARDARTQATATGTRVLVVLALALACSLSVEGATASRLAGVLAPHGMMRATATFVAAHRAMVVAIGGCGVLLLGVLWCGRRAPASPEGARVVLVAALLCVGGAAHLRAARIEAFRGFYEEIQAERGEYAFARIGGPPLPAGSLPWPLGGERPVPRRLVHTGVHLTLPDSGCATVTLPDEDGTRRPVTVDDGATYGEALERMAAP